VLRADRGSVRVLGTDLTSLSNRGRDALRAAHIGYIFQLFNLIPYLSVLENIVLPCRVSRERRERLGGVSPERAAAALADALEIGGLLDERVTRLSVGQQQRVAAARALIGAPELVIADEPTSALDSDRRESFLELLFARCADAGATLAFRQPRPPARTHVRPRAAPVRPEPRRAPLMFLLSLVRKSLANRLLATTLTLASIALSVALLLGIENVRAGMRDSFSNTISSTDLIVGARGGTLQLLLYSVFGIGSPTNNISWETYERLSRHPAVAWTIPHLTGRQPPRLPRGGHRQLVLPPLPLRPGALHHVRGGHGAEQPHDVVIGQQVAQTLGYGIGSEVVITHGLHGTGIMDHDEAPFRVVGILDRTFTPVDRSLYVTLQGIDAMHEGFMADAFAAPGGAPPNFAAPPSFAEPPPGVDPAALHRGGRARQAGREAQHAHDEAADTHAMRMRRRRSRSRRSSSARRHALRRCSCSGRSTRWRTSR
jgi:ABC-type transport system involved in cytochrome c biogenesis ATPase subunit